MENQSGSNDLKLRPGDWGGGVETVGRSFQVAGGNSSIEGPTERGIRCKRSCTIFSFNFLKC